MDKGPVFRFTEATAPLITELISTLDKTGNRNDPNTNDETLSSNPIAKSSSVLDEDLHGHSLKFQTRLGDLFLILIIIFQLRPETEPMCSPAECLHKRFNWGFIKDNSIPTYPNHLTKCRCARK
jgi:hypothetical protein